MEVSVIVPARDAAPYLGDALESLTRQDVALESLEVIVVDDGSVDETPEVAAAFAQRLPGLRVLYHRSPQGLAASRNHALAEARGRHLAFLDADDWLWPGTLAAALATRIRLDVDFVVVDQVMVTGHERTVRRAPEHRREQRLVPRDSILPTTRTTMVNYPNACVRVCHRRLLDAGLLRFDGDLRTAEDRPWTWRLHLHAESFAVASSGLYGYRRAVPGSLTAAADDRQLDVVDAYAAVLRMTTGSLESFAPKAVRDLLAVVTNHLRPESTLAGEVRAELARRTSDLLERVDARILSDQVHGLGDERAALLREAGVGV